MLFGFLSELQRDIFNQLPFVLQMRIARFVPNLPHLIPTQNDLLRFHYNKRYCKHCGNALVICHKPSFCLCKKRFTVYKYHIPVRPYKMYTRPLKIMKESLISPLRLFVQQYIEEGRLCYVVSNQPESLYSISFALDVKKIERFQWTYGNQLESLYKKMVRYMVNANTCVRSYCDLFGTLDHVRQISFPVKTLSVWGKTISQNPKVLTNYVIDQYAMHHEIPEVSAKAFARRMLFLDESKKYM